jgi:hypothetical protein
MASRMQPDANTSPAGLSETVRPSLRPATYCTPPPPRGALQAKASSEAAPRPASGHATGSAARPGELSSSLPRRDGSAAADAVSPAAHLKPLKLRAAGPPSGSPLRLDSGVRAGMAAQLQRLADDSTMSGSALLAHRSPDATGTAQTRPIAGTPASPEPLQQQPPGRRLGGSPACSRRLQASRRRSPSRQHSASPTLRISPSSRNARTPAAGAQAAATAQGVQPSAADREPLSRRDIAAVQYVAAGTAPNPLVTTGGEESDAGRACASVHECYLRHVYAGIPKGARLLLSTSRSSGSIFAGDMRIAALAGRNCNACSLLDLPQATHILHQKSTYMQATCRAT